MGAGDKQEARLELLEEDDSLSTESTREEDQDLSGLHASSELGRTVLSGSGSPVYVFGGVPLRDFRVLLDH